MVWQTNITFPAHIWFSDDFQELKKKRKLSSTITSLLEQHLKVAKQDNNQDKTKIELELQELAARRALLLDRKEQLEKDEEEEKNRYTVI